jgi:hypothetical protein
MQPAWLIEKFFFTKEFLEESPFPGTGNGLMHPVVIT